jgi:ABC-2 type transport system ATP-binding protein
MAGMLTADSVRKAYGTTTALDGASLSVDAGEVYALVGPNGAGKTTLVQCLTGTTSPTAGDVRLFGEPPGAADWSRVGYLPQSFTPHERLTTRELVDYYAGLYPSPRDTDAVLAEVGLTDSATTRYEALSGGQQRRACVGIALINDPDVLFLDEPTTGVDPAGRRAIWRLVDGLAAAGTAVFLTTHYMAEAEFLADRVGLLAGGELIDEGPPAALVEAHGGDPTLVVETAVTAEANLDGAPFAATDRGDHIELADIGPTEIGDALTYLEENGVEYMGVHWTQPDLEDVYLALATEDAEATPAHATGLETGVRS